MSAGYNIPISVADASSAQTDPFDDSATTFIFGNGDSATDNPTQESASTPTATVAASESGPASAGASVSAPLGETVVPSESSTSSSSSLILILILAAGAFLLMHFLRHGKI